MNGGKKKKKKSDHLMGGGGASFFWVFFLFLLKKMEEKSHCLMGLEKKKRKEEDNSGKENGRSALWRPKEGEWGGNPGAKGGHWDSAERAELLRGLSLLKRKDCFSSDQGVYRKKGVELGGGVKKKKIKRKRAKITHPPNHWDLNPSMGNSQPEHPRNTFSVVSHHRGTGKLGANKKIGKQPKKQKSER